MDQKLLAATPSVRSAHLRARYAEDDRALGLAHINSLQWH
jgi:hypothetical protein